MKTLTLLTKHSFAYALLTLLIACGGGGGGDSKSSFQQEQTQTQTQTQTQAGSQTPSTNTDPNPPVINGAIKDKIDLSVADGQAFSYTIDASDADGDAISYRLYGADQAEFNLHPDTGILTLKVPADYTTKPKYQIRVEAQAKEKKVQVTIVLSVAKPKHPDLTVMGYNIMQLPAQDWDQKKRTAHLKDALLAMEKKPDVIAFSEVFTDGGYDAIKSMKADYPYITPILGLVCEVSSDKRWNSIKGNCSNSFGVVRGGVVIASKYPIEAQHAYVFKAVQTGTWDNNANKGAVYAKIKRDDFNYHVVATHTQATHSASDAAEAHTVRVKQVTEIRTWIDTFNIAKTDPVIVAGDLNVEHDKPTELKAIIDTGLKATLWFDKGKAKNYVHSYPENNWMARAYNYSSGGDMCYNKTLDYVVTLRDYLQPSKPAQQDVIALKAAKKWYWSYLHGSWSLCGGSQSHNGDTTDLSDHYPVMATYTYK